MQQSNQSFKDLTVYKKAFELAMEIFEVSEEKFEELQAKSEEVGRMLNHMIENPEKYIRAKEKSLTIE